MKTGIKGYILVLFAILFVVDGSVWASFPDIFNSPYKESIDYLQTNGVVSGYPDGSFGPDRNISRAEILKIILESSLDTELPSTINCFPDVQDQRYAKYVCYAKTHHIVKWYPDGTFQPWKSVSNAEALKMSLESFGFHKPAKIGERRYQWYLDFVHNNNIFSKYALWADTPMTRAQMAYLTHQLMLEKKWERTFTNVRSIPKTAGCGIAKPSVAPNSVWVNGQERHFITAVWSKYNPDTPTNLVIAFHGRTNANSRVRTYYHIEEASQGNAIVVYPSGLPEDSSPRNRSNPWDPSDQLRDFALFDAIVKDISDKYCINQDRIFVIGHSLWARFTNSLACARGDVIRAIGSVWWSTTKNNCSGPTAAIIMHNPDDNLASFAWGLTARNQLLAQNGCSSATVPVWPADGHCVRYTDCQEGAPVIRCPHTENYTRWYYYPHSRPSFAASMIWDFFQEQK